MVINGRRRGNSWAVTCTSISAWHWVHVSKRSALRRLRLLNYMLIATGFLHERSSYGNYMYTDKTLFLQRTLPAFDFLRVLFPFSCSRGCLPNSWLQVMQLSPAFVRALRVDSVFSRASRAKTIPCCSWQPHTTPQNTQDGILNINWRRECLLYTPICRRGIREKRKHVSRFD